VVVWGLGWCLEMRFFGYWGGIRPTPPFWVCGKGGCVGCVRKFVLEIEPSQLRGGGALNRAITRSIKDRRGTNLQEGGDMENSEAL